MSIPQQMMSKVHQGSIMGPLVFSLFVTDLPNCLTAFNELMYAGDTILYYAASDANHLFQVLNDELKFLLDWSNKNDLFSVILRKLNMQYLKLNCYAT